MPRRTFNRPISTNCTMPRIQETNSREIICSECGKRVQAQARQVVCKSKECIKARRKRLAKPPRIKKNKDMPFWIF